MAKRYLGKLAATLSPIRVNRLLSGRKKRIDGFCSPFLELNYNIDFCCFSKCRDDFS